MNKQLSKTGGGVDEAGLGNGEPKQVDNVFMLIGFLEWSTWLTTRQFEGGQPNLHWDVGTTFDEAQRRSTEVGVVCRLFWPPCKTWLLFILLHGSQCLDKQIEFMLNCYRTSAELPLFCFNISDNRLYGAAAHRPPAILQQIVLLRRSAKKRSLY